MQLVKNLPLIMMNEIGYEYPNGTKALKNINLNIFRGELVGIMGKNGAGKTSLIRTLNGLIRPNHGCIYIENENIKTKSIATLSKRVGIIFQNPFHQLFANSVEEEIRFSLKNLNLTKEEVQVKIDQILCEFDLEKYRTRSPLNLSGGESKKLAVASIICRNPEILIFDEPTLGQDAREIEFFLDLINSERKKGKTIIIITHNIEFAFEHLPRIILMADGHIIADGPTDQLLNNEFLIKQTSLVLPQIRQLYIALQQFDLELKADIISKNEMVNYLRKLITSKSSKI